MIKPLLKHLLPTLMLAGFGTRAEARSWLEKVDHALFGANSETEIYNEGVSLYRAGKFDDALSKFQLAGASSDRALKAKALHNAALVHVQKKEWPAARDLLKQALAFQNDSKEIRENLEWVEKQVDEQNPEQKQDPKTADQKDQNGEKKPSEEKTAEEQPGEKKPAEQKSAEEKAAEEKKAEEQKSAEAKDKSAEQKSAEQKAAEQKAAEEKTADAKDKASEDAQKQNEQKLAEESQDKKDEAEKKKAEAYQQSQDQKDSPAGKDKPQNGVSLQEAPSGTEDKPLTQAEIKQQEAERLLREIDDKIGQYPLTDTEATGKRGNDGKNW